MKEKFVFFSFLYIPIWKCSSHASLSLDMMCPIEARLDYRHSWANDNTGKQQVYNNVYNSASSTSSIRSHYDANNVVSCIFKCLLENGKLWKTFTFSLSAEKQQRDLDYTPIQLMMTTAIQNCHFFPFPSLSLCVCVCVNDYCSKAGKWL